MEIIFLGAHNIESDKTRTLCILVDGILALDAGCLTSSLSFTDQMKLQAVLLTHPHYDHVRDMPAIGMNFSLHGKVLDVYAIRPVFDALKAHLLNGELYPDFFARPEKKPSLRAHVVKPGEKFDVAGYEVLALTMPHSVPAAGFQLVAPDGRCLFYTGDSGIDTPEKWMSIHPDLLIFEITASNEREDFALQSGHLTADLLQQELSRFRDVKGYLPRIITVHMNPLEEAVIRSELDVVERNLDVTIETACEGMRLSV